MCARLEIIDASPTRWMILAEYWRQGTKSLESYLSTSTSSGLWIKLSDTTVHIAYHPIYFAHPDLHTVVMSSKRPKKLFNWLQKNAATWSMKIISRKEENVVSVVVEFQTHAVVNLVILQCYMILVYRVPLLNSVHIVGCVIRKY